MKNLLKSVKTIISCVVLAVNILLLSSCSNPLFTTYNTPEKAIESAYDDNMGDADIYRIDERVDLIEQDDIAIYIYKSANKTLQIAYLEKRGDGYAMHELKTYYEKSDVTTKVETTDNLSTNNRLYCELSQKVDDSLEGYVQKTYQINVFGQTNSYYFYYKIEHK